MEIQGYESYLIYDDGRVYSKKSNRFLKERGIDKYKRYITYQLYDKKGFKREHRKHRLLAQHYIPNPENKSHVNHIDGDRTNNHISNLEWLTHIENQNAYMPIQKNNKSGHKKISFNKGGYWYFTTIYYGNRISKYFKNKTDALCYKYIILLRIKAGHFDRLIS